MSNLSGRMFLAGFKVILHFKSKMFAYNIQNQHKSCKRFSKKFSQIYRRIRCN